MTGVDDRTAPTIDEVQLEATTPEVVPDTISLKTPVAP